MILHRIPGLVHLISGRYRDIFEDAGISYSMLCLLIAMTLLGIPSLSLLVRLIPFSPSVSTLSRNLNKIDEKCMNRCQRRMAWSVLKRVKKQTEKWIFVIDTTENIKRTRALLGQGYWANSKHEIYYGQNMMVICVVNKETGESIPISYKPCLKEHEREKNRTNHHLVLDLMDELLAFGYPKLDLTLDSWFDSSCLMTELSKRKITFVIQLKSNRKPKKNPGPRHRKISLCEIFTGLKRESFLCTTRDSKEPIWKDWKNVRFISGLKVWISGSEKGAKQICIQVAAVYNHPKERNAFGYYATNDLSKSFTWCWKMSRYRWNIEVCFRDLRQNFNWGKYAAKQPEGALFAWIIPMMIMAYLREKNSKKPISTIISEIKNTEMMSTIDFHAKHPYSKQREKLRIRLLGTHANKKPRIHYSDDRKFKEKSKICIKNIA